MSKFLYGEHRTHLKFASPLPTCGFVGQLVVALNWYLPWEARVQAPSKSEFFYQASFSAISLISVYLRGSIYQILNSSSHNWHRQEQDWELIQLAFPHLSFTLNLFCRNIDLTPCLRHSHLPIVSCRIDHSVSILQSKFHRFSAVVSYCLVHTEAKQRYFVAIV